MARGGVVVFGGQYDTGRCARIGESFSRKTRAALF